MDSYQVLQLQSPPSRGQALRELCEAATADIKSMVSATEHTENTEIIFNFELRNAWGGNLSVEFEKKKG